MKCFILGCSNRTDIKNPGISFHRIPEEQFETWMRISERTDSLPYSDKRRICSEHFNINSFISAGTRKVLKTDAVPTLKMKQSFRIPQSSVNIPLAVSSTSQSDVSLSEGQDRKLSVTSSSPSDGLIGSLKRRRRDVSIVHNYCEVQDRKLSEISISDDEDLIDSLKRSRQDIRIIHNYCKVQEKTLPETSTSENERLIDSLKRSRQQDVRTTQSYCLSPRKMLDDLNRLERYKYLLQKQFKIPNEKVERLSTHVMHLKDVIKELAKNKTND